MSVKRIMVANLVISLVVLVLLCVGLWFTCFGEVDVEPVVYECSCSVEETTESVTEPTEDVTEATEEVIESTESIEQHYLGKYMLTAYCACEKCCGQYANGITATGTVATQGRTIAVDPKVIPYGTEVIINGHTYIAEDCGGAIKGNRIDVYFDDHNEALKFGVQYADIYIVRS